MSGLIHESVGSNNVSTTNQKGKEDSSLRKKPCRRYIKLCTMFDRNTANGNRARSSAQLLPDLIEEEQSLSDYPIELDDDMPSQLVPAASGHSKRRRARQPRLDRVIRSFETTTQTITSALIENTMQECKDVMAALRDIPDISVETRVKVAEYYAKHNVARQMFLACDADERREYVNLISDI